MRWLTERIFPAEDKLTADDVYYGTLLACMEMARGGTVSASDMYFFTMAMGEAFSDAGMKVNLSPCLTCSDGRRFDELRHDPVEGILRAVRIADVRAHISAHRAVNVPLCEVFRRFLVLMRQECGVRLV